MIPLKLTQKAFILLCVCPAKENIVWKNRFKNYFVAISAFVSLILFMITSVVFIRNNFKQNFELTLYALLQVVHLAVPLYSLIIAHLQRNKLSNIFTNLENLRDASKFFEVGKCVINSTITDTPIQSGNIDRNIDTLKYMDQADQRAEKLRLFANFFAIICPIMLSLLGLMSMIYSQLRFGFIDTSVLYRSHVGSYVFIFFKIYFFK